MGDDDFLSKAPDLLRVGLLILSVLFASGLHLAWESVPEVVPPYAVIPITFIGLCVCGSLALEFSVRRREHPESLVLTKLWRGDLDQSDKEDMFFMLSIMLLVTWYDHARGYTLGVTGVYIALGAGVAVSLLWRRWTTGRWKPVPASDRTMGETGVSGAAPGRDLHSDGSAHG